MHRRPQQKAGEICGLGTFDRGRPGIGVEMDIEPWSYFTKSTTVAEKEAGKATMTTRLRVS